MNTIETYKQEIETDLDHAREKFIALKTKIRGFTDVERLDSLEEVEGLEQIASDIRTKIKQLNKEMEDSWEQIKVDIYSSQNRVNDSFARLNRSLV